MITTKIIFDRKKQAKKDGEGTIEIRVISERKTIYISTGVRVRDKEWKAGMVINRPDAPELNLRLAIIYEKVTSEANRCIKDGEPINSEVIKRKVWQTKEAVSDQPTFLDWLDRQIGLLTLKEGTVKHYKTLLTRLIEFDKIRNWQDVTTENIYEFDSWLHKRTIGSGEYITDGAVYKYHKCLKAMLKKAVIFKKIERSPYEFMKFRRGENESIEFLTEDEMRAFELVMPPTGSQLDVAHDLFIFQMYTGLSYSDAQAFDFSHYKFDGMSWKNTGERIKTGVPYVSQLLPPVIRVLEKYGWQVPKIDNADYNHLLKALGVMAGINSRMHTHLARHTFATYMLRKGVKVENLQRMLGHKNIRQTMRYAKVLAESVHEDFDMVAEKMFDQKSKIKIK